VRHDDTPTDADGTAERLPGMGLTAADLFEGAGLLAPPVPEHLAANFVERGRWFFASRKPPGNMCNVPQFASEVAAEPVSDYVAVAHAGHGINSYAISYALVYGPLAVFTQCGWGGVYMDHGDTAAVSEMFLLCGALISAVDARAAPLRSPPARLIVSDDHFTGGGGFCEWLDEPLRHPESAERWRQEAVRRSGSGAESTERELRWRFLRSALEIVSAPD
jgi:hypothetical protein